MTTLVEQIAERRTELADSKHTPTRAMQVNAKRGLRLSQQHNDMDPVAVSVGRKVASGQKLSSDHVEQMAAYHAAHDGDCPTGTDMSSSEDSLWGGAAGAAWSSARVAAMDVSDLAQVEGPTILQLDQEGKGVSLEVFVRDQLGEPMEVDEERKVIWAPILRSGMLATRPGPNGEKLDQPLVFVPGLAADSRKEIGLQNLYDNFKAGAIQHVTVPTSHDNDVLSNTGFIVDMRLVPSTKRPGEMVLAAAHDIRDPDVRRKIELGTIANRSCGIVYDYKRTEDGRSFDQVVEHVALTNKPWVTGMAPYGELDGDDDFADRDIVPMLLSEAPLKLASSTSDSWDGSAGRFSDQQWARSCVLDRGEGTPKERYSLPIREPDGAVNSNGVHAAASRINQIKGASLAQKKAAARKLVAAYRTVGDQPPTNLTQLVAASTNMSEQDRRESLLLADIMWGDELSLNEISSQVTALLDEFRVSGEYFPNYWVMDVTPEKALVKCEYGDPDGVSDAWVIPISVDGHKVELGQFSEWSPVEQQWVTDDDAAQDKQELHAILGGQELPEVTPTSALSEREQAVLRLSERSNHQQGGAMPPTTQEALDRLGLSEDQRAVLFPLITEAEQLKTQLAEVTKAARKDKVVARVKELQEKSFPPGFCRRYEEIALADDGEVAAVLNLSDDKGAQSGQRNYTATELAESLIQTLPVDESGKLALASAGHLLTSPISERPPVDAEDQAKVEGTDKKGPLTAEEWLAQAEKDSPGIAKTLNLSTEKKEG